MCSITKKTRKYTIVNNTMRFSNTFNESLEPYIYAMSQHNTTVLKMGKAYNQPFVLRSNTLYYKIMELNFGRGFSFNQPIDLTPNTVELSFGRDFDQPIVLTSNIRVLNFGRCFNQPIVLTRNVEIVIFREFLINQLF